MNLINRFFKYIFFNEKQLVYKDPPRNNIYKRKHFSENTHIKYPQGDFYVIDGECTRCGAPEAEAPDLIEHLNEEYGHCYFKKQPETIDEINRAINAVAVSCTDGLRYGGINEYILGKLHKEGLQSVCDNLPIYQYNVIIRNKVEFLFDGSIQELQNLLLTKIPIRDYYKIVDFISNEMNYFQFTLRWTDGLTGTIYKCNFASKELCTIEMTKETDGYLYSIRSNSADLDTILSNQENISEINWYGINGDLKPY